MNATIVKIINLLFEDIEENEETRAIHEEILTNCQDRYEDLLRSGLSEDDAIHAVIESLKGMEEMLKDYPRKKAEAEPTATQKPVEEAAEVPAAEEQESPHWTLDPSLSPIHEIRCLRMGSTNVRVETSDDGLIHVICEGNTATLVTGIDAGVLSVVLTPSDKASAATKHTEFSFNLGDAKVKGKFSFDLDDLGMFFKKLANRLATMTADCSICIRIPQALIPTLSLDTSSGDISLSAITLENLTVSSASGDIELDAVAARGDIRLNTASGDILSEDLRCGELKINTASGDVTAREASVTGSVRLNSASGDIEWMGECRELDVSTASGDLRLSGTFVRASFRTVSGDANIAVHSSALEALQGKTSSGDQRVLLPSGTDLCVSCRTSSGDIRQHCPSRPEGAVKVDLQSNSGDITVR